MKLLPRPPRDPEHDRLTEAAAKAIQAYADARRAYDAGRATAQTLADARDAYHAAEAAYNAAYHASGQPRRPRPGALWAEERTP